MRIIVVTCCLAVALMESGFAGTKSENLAPSTPVSMSETAGSLSNAMSRTGISYRLQDNRLSLSDGPIVIRDAAFGAVILENGRSRVICPQDEPIVESVVCETPLGRGLETVYSWTMPEGYGFKYKVTRVGSDRLTVRCIRSIYSASCCWIRRVAVLPCGVPQPTGCWPRPMWRRAAWERSSGRFLRKMRFG